MAADRRGGSAADILSLARFFWRPGLALVAPQAPDHTWYPSRFLAPFEENEPALSESLATVGRVVEEAREAGIPEERLVLVGFSQGACLAAEWTARHGKRLGGLVAYNGGLIGPIAPATYTEAPAARRAISTPFRLISSRFPSSR